MTRRDLGLQGRSVGRPGKAETYSIREGELPEKGVGEAVKKVFEERQRIGRKDLQERFLESDSADDARRLYVKKSFSVRTDSEKRDEQKSQEKPPERRKAPRCSDVRILREFLAGSPERLYERKREKAKRTTDGRGTRHEDTRLLLKRCPHSGFTLCYP